MPLDWFVLGSNIKVHDTGEYKSQRDDKRFFISIVSGVSPRSEPDYTGETDERDLSASLLARVW